VKGITLRRVFRAVVFLLSFAAGAAVVLVFAGSALAWSGLGRTPMALDIAEGVGPVGVRMSHDAHVRKVLMLGDSVLNPAVPHPVPTSTQLALHEKGPRGRGIRIYPLSWPGWSLAGQYCLLDDLLRLGPDQVLLELNFRGLTVESARGFSQGELAGFLSADHYLEALSLPLPQAGVTPDRLLFYRTLVAGKELRTWKTLLDIQARLYNAREPAEQAFERFVGVNSMATRKLALLFEAVHRAYAAGQDRESRDRAIASLSPTLAGIEPDFPPLATLAAVVRRVAASGRSPLVWIAPINVDHLLKLDVDVRGLDRSVRSVRRVVEESGGELVDFHASLRDKDFADAGDHPSTDGERTGAELLGDLLARALLDSEAKAEARRKRSSR
jgi:hypothetical protein